MKYKQNWEQTKQRFGKWWKRSNEEGPVMIVVAKKEDAPVVEMAEFATIEEQYLNAEKIVHNYRNYCETHEFLRESFPNLSLDFGPGSIAAYLGGGIEFREDTVWFHSNIQDFYSAPPLCYDENDFWFRKHIELFSKAKQLVGDDFLLTIPDLMENLDVLASLRGTQELVFDLIDYPEEIGKRVAEVQNVYFKYYDAFFDIVKQADTSSAYTVFQIWGEGKTAKLQCDFSALMSPQQFKEFVVEPLRRQAKKLDNVLYHLDGPDAIKHLDYIMQIDEIDALQWTSGDYNPDGLCEQWYEIYDKAYAANKCIWVRAYDGGLNDWIEGSDKLISRYGSSRLLIMYPEMSRNDADILVKYAEKNWKGK